MKTLLKKITFQLTFFTLAANCASVLHALPAAADSTADLVLNLQCQEGYEVQIWRNRTSGALQYRSQSPLGSLSLNGGTVRPTEGVRLYEFQNGSYRYAIWDGTLDSQNEGTLEVYRNNYILVQQPCRKV